MIIWRKHDGYMAAQGLADALFRLGLGEHRRDPRNKRNINIYNRAAMNYREKWKKKP